MAIHSSPFPTKTHQKKKKQQLIFEQKMGRISQDFLQVFLLVSYLFNQRICLADRFTFNHTVKLWDSREMFGKPRGNVWDTIPETNVAPENRPLEKEIPIGNHHFQVLC